ncbi:MAG: exodeoxyribonuclease VII large subunit [Clostridiales bacterium]|nr:exodeoxyribonuclease VII large subunit [Clostridiales bacterium]
MQFSTLSVSDLNEYVRRSLAGDPMLQGIALRGELSNFRPYASGHWYFSLKDEESRIACVMFRQHNMQLDFKPKDGMKLILIGSAGLYASSGNYQFYAEAMLEDGIGVLYQRYQVLKDKLLKEGLFDTSKKRPLPLLPRAVGIITSASGAVLHDIKTVAERRFPNIQLILRASQVQGEGAKEDLVRSIKELEQLEQVDVIIIGRGGGSMEDLWAFNEEAVVRAIANCKKPIISAVGHETDTTLSDFAADVRAATPSAAAELAVPEKIEIKRVISSMQSAFHQEVNTRLLQYTTIVQDLCRELALHKPDLLLQAYANRLNDALRSLQALTKQSIEIYSAKLSNMCAALKALGPGNTLKRGYTLAFAEGKPIAYARNLPEHFHLVFQDGKAEVRLISLKMEEF